MAKMPMEFEDLSSYIKISQQNITSTTTTFSLSGSYKFSDFKEFVILFYINSSVRSITYIPLAGIMSGGVYAVIPSGTAMNSAYMQQASDTTYSASSAAANIIAIYAK